jgi:hypothetical protein
VIQANAAEDGVDRGPLILLALAREVDTHPVNGASVFDIRAILGGENIGRELTLMCSEHSTE